MSLYNMLFEMNPQSNLLLAVIGLKKNDVERFRDVSASEDGTEITVYTRTGGGNREDYPNLAMRKLLTWQGSVDDDYDSTYCTDTFKVPAEFIEDVKALNDIIGNGLRREFGEHLIKTLRREPTKGDEEATAYEAESRELFRTKHLMANGHTFVPMDDGAMETALKLAEANRGKLRSAWGIMPVLLTVQTNHHPWPNAKNESDREHVVRVEVGYDHVWKIDVPYWEHCQKRFASKYPLSMAAIAREVENRLQRAE
jgi:hypothetical protein